MRHRARVPTRQHRPRAGGLPRWRTDPLGPVRHRAGGLPRWSPPATGRRCARVLSLELSGLGRRRARDVVRVCHGARAADAVPAPHGARRPRCWSRASVPLRRRPRRQSRRRRASSTRGPEATVPEPPRLGPPVPPRQLHGSHTRGGHCAGATSAAARALARESGLPSPSRR